MATELIAGLGFLKTAFDLAKGLKDINDATVRKTAVAELLDKLISAQEAQAAMLKRVDALEAEVARLKAWDGEKERYELKDVGRRGGMNVFVYALRQQDGEVEPPHQLCPHCYQDRRKSILQATTALRVGLRVHVCPNCKNEFDF